MGFNPILSKFAKLYPLRTYRKGDVVVFQGEVPRYVFVIAKGRIKAYNLTLEGDEKPVAFYESGDFFPSAWVFDQVASSTFFYESITKQSAVYCIERDKFVSFLKSSPELVYNTLTRQVSEELSQSMHINALQQSRASDKILYTLHFLAISSGQRPVHQQLSLKMHLTHQDLANLTGLTRETTAVELNKLKKQGLITYGPGQPYVIHLSQLANLANDRYLQELTMPSELPERR